MNRTNADSGIPFDSIRSENALNIAHSEYASASGPIPFPLERGDYIRLTGRPSQYRGMPQLEIIEAELVPPEFHDPAEVIFARHGIPKDRLAKLRETYGDDFAEAVLAEPFEAVKSLAHPRTRTD